MKAYLDNDIVSAIARNDKPEEADALRRLLRAKDDGKVRLVTSELTRTEIKAYQGSMREGLEETFQRFEKVEVVPSDQLIGMQSYGDSRTWITMPMIEKHPDYKMLEITSLAARYRLPAVYPFRFLADFTRTKRMAWISPQRGECEKISCEDAQHIGPVENFHRV